MYQIVSGFAAGRTTIGMLCPILLLQLKTDDDKLEENQRRAVTMLGSLKLCLKIMQIFQELNLFSFQGEYQETVSTDSVRSWGRNLEEKISSQ